MFVKAEIKLNYLILTIKLGVFGPGGNFVPKIKISFDKFSVPYLFALMSYFVCDMTDVVYV